MPRDYVITMTAENRVGVLSAVTKAMAEVGGDLREASQTVVHGFFTMIISAEFPDHLERQVVKDHLLDVCRPFHIKVSINEPPDTVSTAGQKNGGRMVLRVLRLGGDNQPGVLRKLSSLISMKRIDITGMHAVRTKAGQGFEMIMKIAVPESMDTQKLLTELNATGQSFNITADLSDAP